MLTVLTFFCSNLLFNESVSTSCESERDIKETVNTAVGKRLMAAVGTFNSNIQICGRLRQFWLWRPHYKLSKKKVQTLHHFNWLLSAVLWVACQWTVVNTVI